MAVGTQDSVYDFTSGGVLSTTMNMGSTVVRLASSSDGRLAVLLESDSDPTTQVEVFDANHNLLWYEGGFSDPEGIRFDAQGHLWIADAMAGTVSSFDTAGAPVTSFGVYGYFTGQMIPTDVAVDSLGNVLVAEFDSGRISKFSPTGQFLTTWYCPAQFEPYSISIDASDRVR